MCVCLCIVLSSAIMALSAKAGRYLCESVWMESGRYQQAEAAYHQVVGQRRAGLEPQVGVRTARVDPRVCECERWMLLHECITIVIIYTTQLCSMTR